MGHLGYDYKSEGISYEFSQFRAKLADEENLLVSKEMNTQLVH